MTDDQTPMTNCFGTCLTMRDLTKRKILTIGFQNGTFWWYGTAMHTVRQEKKSCLALSKTPRKIQPYRKANSETQSTMD